MQHGLVSLYVEWKEEPDTDSVRDLLRSHGIDIIGTDENTDLKCTPGLSPRHENTLFRLRPGRNKPLHELLSEVAMLPNVYSVGEITGMFP